MLLAHKTSRDLCPLGYKLASLSSSTCLIYLHGLRLPFGLRGYLPVIQKTASPSMPLPIRSALCPENWARFPELPQRRFTPKHNSAAYRNLSGCCRDFKSEKAKTAAVSRNQGNPRVFRTQNIKHGIPSIILCSGSAPGFFSAILRVSGSGLCFTASFLLR